MRGRRSHSDCAVPRCALLRYAYSAHNDNPALGAPIEQRKRASGDTQRGADTQAKRPRLAGPKGRDANSQTHNHPVRRFAMIPCIWDAGVVARRN